MSVDKISVPAAAVWWPLSLKAAIPPLAVGWWLLLREFPGWFAAAGQKGLLALLGLGAMTGVLLAVSLWIVVMTVRHRPRGKDPLPDDRYRSQEFGWKLKMMDIFWVSVLALAIISLVVAP